MYDIGLLPVQVAFADVAQLIEQLICNHQVAGLSPIIGFLQTKDLADYLLGLFCFTHTFA
jgi:hypothetical protein